MKKPISLLLAAVCAVGMVGAVGCQTEDVVVDNAETINVRLYKAGYGDAFIYELKQKFEAYCAKEGLNYKMNILTPTYGSAGTPMIQEMSRGYEKTKVDLYITGAIIPNQVSPLGEYGEVCEDLSELVLNQTAIGYDGTEEEVIIEKLADDFEPFMVADNGKTYGFNWAQATAGMVVNTKKLAAYGITELPRTTNELFEIFDTVYNGIPGVIEGSDKTKTYPITYSLTTGLGGASGYNTCALESWFAQYDIETFKQFARMEKNVDGQYVGLEDAYKVFDNENLKEVLEAGFQLMDMKYSAYGSSTQTLDQAQGLIMKDAKKQNNAIFMLNGDWFLNEVKANYATKLHDVEFMNVPVISALGVKLFGSDTKYALSDAACDELLSYMCKLVDENKSLQEIIASVQTEKGIALDEADAQAVATARGVVYARGIEHQAFITKGCTKKHIAALVLRMMASNDFAETFLAKSNALTPYTSSLQGESQYKFINETKALSENVHFRAVNARIQGLRSKVMKSDYMFPAMDNLSMYLYSKASSKSYKDAAKELYESSLAKAKTAWEEYLSAN